MARSSENIDTPFKQDVRAAARRFLEELAALSEPPMYHAEQVALITVKYFNGLGRLQDVTYVLTQEVSDAEPVKDPSSSGP